MNYLLIIMTTLVLSTCRPEKEIEVVDEVMFLIDKVPATRHVDNSGREFVWLIWESQRGIKYAKILAKDRADYFVIGMSTTNMNQR